MRSGARCATLVLLAGIAARVAPPHAELPRPVRRAFLDAGIPLDSVAIVVQRVDAPQRADRAPAATCR